MDVDALKAEVDRIRWFHSIDLGNGVVTPGVDRSARRLKGIHMPESLAGMTVLDIGTFDGFYAFEAKRRGAARRATRPCGTHCAPICPSVPPRWSGGWNRPCAANCPNG